MGVAVIRSLLLQNIYHVISAFNIFNMNL